MEAIPLPRPFVFCLQVQTKILRPGRPLGRRQSKTKRGSGPPRKSASGGFSGAQRLPLKTGFSRIPRIFWELKMKNGFNSWVFCPTGCGYDCLGAWPYGRGLPPAPALVESCGFFSYPSGAMTPPGRAPAEWRRNQSAAGGPFWSGG